MLLNCCQLSAVFFCVSFCHALEIDAWPQVAQRDQEPRFQSDAVCPL